MATKRPRIFVNEGRPPVPDMRSGEPDPRAFHRRLPGYRPTPLVDLPGLAKCLGLGQIWIKDESERLGLPAFKILGASWATYRALVAKNGGEFRPWRRIEELSAQLARLRPLTLVAATDGNHGRALARVACLLELAARIYVPAGTSEARIAAIRSEGADVVLVDGTYDAAVARSASEADPEHDLVISDMSWPGYEEIPLWVGEGYATIHREIDEQLRERGARPTVVVVQIGVGAFAASVVSHFRQGARSSVRIVGVEPVGAASALSSAEAGGIVHVPGPHDSIMAGLNCGAPSPVVWPLLESGIDVFVAIEDERARQAMRMLAEEGLVAGETGAAGLGGLLELLEHTEMSERFGLHEAANVILFATEGATDPAAYAATVGRSVREASAT